MAGKVLGVAKGGNTATAVSPAGTKATAEAAEGLARIVGDPPPPSDPGWATPGGALPGAIADGAGFKSSCVAATAMVTASTVRTEIQKLKPLEH